MPAKRAYLSLLVVGSALLVGCTSSEAPPTAAGNGHAATNGAGAASPAAQWADHTHGLPFVIGYEEGLSQVASTQKPAMLFVTTTWCGWCKRLAADSFDDPQVRELLDKFVLVIVDGDTEQEAVAKYDVQGFPHVIFESPSGEKLGECVGYVPADQFRTIVEGALNKTG